MSKTTVIIPNYNGIKYMDDCLSFLARSKSLEDSTQKHDFETIVVDNGSTDGSLELVRDKFPWVRIIALSKNTGFSKAVNEGIKAADTPYVLLLNNDTIVDYSFVAALESEIEKYKDSFSISSKMLSMKQPEIIDDTGDYYCALGWAFTRGKGKNAQRYDKSGKVFAACGGAAIYRRTVFEQIGYFDELHFAYLEDIDIGYRAKLYGYENRYCPGALVYHAGSGSSGSRYNEFKVKLSSCNSVYLIAKNMPLLQVLINLPFLLAGFLIKTMFFVKKGYGLTYVKGLGRGICLAFSKQGRQNRVPVSWGRVPCYLRIQLELWINILRRFCLS